MAKNVVSPGAIAPMKQGKDSRGLERLYDPLILRRTNKKKKKKNSAKETTISVNIEVSLQIFRISIEKKYRGEWSFGNT